MCVWCQAHIHTAWYKNIQDLFLLTSNEGPTLKKNAVLIVPIMQARVYEAL